MIDESKLIEKEKHSELIFDGKVLHLYRDEIILPDGSEGIREYCNHNGGVCVLPLTDDGEVICVRQYRYACEKVVLEIPAGKLEADEWDDICGAALRELKEETGATPSHLIYLGMVHPNPALLSEQIHIFFARGLTFGDQKLDVDEFLECLKIPFDEMLSMVERGEIVDAKTQIAVLRVKNLLDKENR